MFTLCDHLSITLINKHIFTEFEKIYLDLKIQIVLLLLFFLFHALYNRVCELMYVLYCFVFVEKYLPRKPNI